MFISTEYPTGLRQVKPPNHVAGMEQLVSNSISRPRMYAALLGLFATVAVALAAIGIYGVIAYSVGQRTREIGIRVALGAPRTEVMGLVLRQSIVLSLVGIVLGILGLRPSHDTLRGCCLASRRLIRRLSSVVSLIFASVAALAAFVPARRASKADPLTALRYE